MRTTRLLAIFMVKRAPDDGVEKGDGETQILIAKNKPAHSLCFIARLQPEMLCSLRPERCVQISWDPLAGFRGIDVVPMTRRDGLSIVRAASPALQALVPPDACRGVRVSRRATSGQRR